MGYKDFKGHYRRTKDIDKTKYALHTPTNSLRKCIIYTTCDNFVIKGEKVTLWTWTLVPKEPADPGTGKPCLHYYHKNPETATTEVGWVAGEWTCEELEYNNQKPFRRLYGKELKTVLWEMERKKRHGAPQSNSQR